MLQVGLCKTVGSAYVGSNPTPATSRNTRPGTLCVLWQRRSRERCATSSANVGSCAFPLVSADGIDLVRGDGESPGEYAEKSGAGVRAS